MDIRQWNQNIAFLVKQRNGLLLMSIGLLISTIILSFVVLLKDERVIVVPAGFKQSFWNEGSLVSESYIEEMSLFFTKLMLESTPDSHNYRKDVILRYVAPQYYHELEKKLLQDAKMMRKEGLTTTFAPKQVIVNLKELKAEVIGTSTHYIAGTRIAQKKERYELTFSYSAGIFMLVGFQTKYES